ncbi:ferrous iron transport protein B [Methanobacterium veterum]|uniref:Ferrous iron transport protein B n=1 Tax=Methanobacterium veterum TaxID=408577 RepID=A0A9E4ZY38_9EURY|nr:MULTISPECIES: ferrous iron transport protein B [Methanobacterium]MCZ3367396.1 ferrous iron transport protein B [Methanobacterium veterum]MCZ3373456.1 ferrous iron transport protein B [Methanobacterium veterum]
MALAGNANVGKSVIFNDLTGSNQIIGNWPGKTIERAEGKLHFEGYDIDVIDLPGIYSFSTYSLEEIVSREYIALEKPDVVINVVDAAVLERNLFFTMQLVEMEVPLVICVNQIDIAKQKGINIDTEKLQAALGVPVVATVAVRGEGLHELMETAIETAEKKENKFTIQEYGSEVENRIKKLTDLIRSKNLDLGYPSRWIAIKLIENDPEIQKLVKSKSEEVANLAYNLAGEIEDIHREPSFSVIASERYALANRIAEGAQMQSEIKITFSEKLDRIVTHRVYGYITSALVIGGLLLWTFVVGNFFSGLLSDAFSFFQPVDPQISGGLVSVLWNGAFGGIVAGVTLVIPFVVPFYIMLSLIENSGILTRVAFMMDTLMHKIGLHGKALIPMILGYGCNVPAIDQTRILETRRERLLASFAITFAPCAARTIIVLGLVAVFVNIWWAIALYAIDLAIIFIMGRIALKVVPGESTGLIMEMHSFKVPSLSTALKQTWTRTKSLIYLVLPIYVIASALIQALYVLGVLGPINAALTPITVMWLGLPAISGILLIFGIVRKEFVLLMLVTLVGPNLAAFLTPVQFIVLALVSMLFIPCLSTITILIREFGVKAATYISAANLITAIVIGGVAFRVLSLVF